MKIQLTEISYEEAIALAFSHRVRIVRGNGIYAKGEPSNLIAYYAELYGVPRRIAKREIYIAGAILHDVSVPELVIFYGFLTLLSLVVLFW